MKIKIVVVDDDDTDRYILKRAVQSLNYDVDFIEFESGDHFINVVKEPETRAASFGVPPPPILVFLDINMPRMNGFEVLKSLKALLADDDQFFVVTMYSSSNHAEDRADALQYKFVKDYVVKPITSDRLDEIITRHFSL